MSAIVVFYLMLFAGLAVGGLWIDIRERRPAWFIALAAVSDAVIINLFLAYFDHSLRTWMDPVAPVAYVVALGWQLLQVYDEFRAVEPDPEGGEDVPERLSDVVLVITAALCLPAYVGAGFAAFRS